MMSPMDAAGVERLRQARACIRKTFGPGGSGRRTKRGLDMRGEAPTPVKTPRTKLRQRIAKASQLNTEQLFFQEFGSCEELMKEEFDLARPAGYPTKSHAPTGVSTHAAPTSAAPTNFFSFSSSVSTFTSALPAPSTTHVSQLTRPSRVWTPRKAAVKRGRTGVSSAEKELVLRKPRLGGTSAKSTHLSTAGSTFGAPTSALPSFEPRSSFAFVTNRGEHLQPSSSQFFPRKSPSKLQFSSNATRLFSQRQAPLW
ncbi:hypothetical protein PHMEG_0007281 [Phytophthora megakarya]|uniref:Uncharacterized protein n=1 Tax=Phytophthora megakarya TaxID=4795 RepID=A0A225WLN5_9STRA|nr:hypothetical protein PHMEG_0007281 [Phytophthora megakarya]